MSNYTEEFRENGVVLIRGLLPKDLIQECLQALVEYKDFEKPVSDKNAIFDESKDGKKFLKYFQNANFYIPTLWKLYNARLLEIADSLLDQRTYFYGIGVHDKAPREGTGTPLHQDNYYWCLEPPHAMTAYVPLQAQSSKNGGVAYIKGSYRKGTLNHEKAKVKAFSSFIEGIDVQEKDLWRPELEPGDVIFHHGNTFHLADGNKSDQHRRAVAVIIYGEKSKLSPEMHARYERNLAYNRS